MDVKIKEEHKLEAVKLAAEKGKLHALKYIYELDDYKVYGLRKLKEWIETTEIVNLINATQQCTLDSTAKRFSVNDVMDFVGSIEDWHKITYLNLKDIILEFAKKNNL